MIVGRLLLVAGAAILAAEIWLATIGVPLPLVVALLVLTGFSEYTVACEVMGDRQPRAHARRALAVAATPRPTPRSAALFHPAECPHLDVIETPTIGQSEGLAVCNNCGTTGWYGRGRA